MPTIKIENLEKTFNRNDGTILQVLGGISFNVAENEFVSLLGPSGSGKSTILNIISGLLDFTGQVNIDGKIDKSKMKIGYVFQSPRLLNWKTVRENIKFVLECSNDLDKEMDNKIDKYLQLVGLSQYENEFPLFLSGGMRARVGIARALSIEPDILLMDEPFSHLDEITAKKIRKELLGIWHKEKKTILFVTHNALEAAYLSDKIYVLSEKPSKVIGEVKVDLLRPRQSDDVSLFKIQKEALNIMRI